MDLRHRSSPIRSLCLPLVAAFAVIAAACGGGGTLVAGDDGEPSTPETTAPAATPTVPATAVPTTVAPTPPTTAAPTIPPTIPPTTVAPPTEVVSDPSNIAEWMAFTASVAGPVDSVAEPFDELFGFSPPDMFGPAGAGLEMREIYAEVEKGAPGSFNDADPPVVDLLRIDATFAVTAMSFDDAVAYFDGDVGVPLEVSEKRETDRGAEAAYLFSRTDDQTDGAYDVVVSDRTDGVSLWIRFTERNNDQADMFDRLATLGNDFPTPLGVAPSAYSIDFDGFSDTITLDITWGFEAADEAGIVADIKSQLPIGPFSDDGTWDGDDNSQLQCAGESVQCQFRLTVFDDGDATLNARPAFRY